MGIWNRANVVGTCAASEVAALRKALTYDRNTMANFHCLVNGGIAGLPNWAAENINAVGNLAERGYTEESVKETLEEIAKSVPSLAVKVHVGEDGELDKCRGTVTLTNGVATVGPPEIENLPAIPDDQMRKHTMAAMGFR